MEMILIGTGFLFGVTELIMTTAQLCEYTKKQ